MATMERATGKEAAQALGDYVNALGADRSDFVEQLTGREHRTLQQASMGLFLQCIDVWAEKRDGQYDLRNADTVMLARKIKAALTAGDMAGFPLHKMVRCV